MVTGANGFLGARLVRRLIEDGESVKAFVRPDSNLDQLRGLPADRLRIAVGDVTLMDRVYAAVRGCKRLYHVAASTSVDERNREWTRRSAVLGTQAVLEAARLAHVEQIVVTSTSLTLGVTREEREMDEEHDFNLEHPNAYLAAKCEAEDVALEYADAGAHVVVVNPGMLVGPGDWRPSPVGRVLLRYLVLSPSFRVPIAPGGFNYVHVDDAARGHVQAMEKGQPGERYILGGENLTHRQVVQTLCDVTGLAEPGDDVTEGKLRLLAWFEELREAFRNSEPLVSRALIDDYFGKFVWVRSDLAREHLGYAPRPVRSAFVESVAWYKAHGYLPERVQRRVRVDAAPSAVVPS